MVGYINLEKDFDLFYYDNCIKIEYSEIKFSAGEPHIKIESPSVISELDDLVITIVLRTSHDMMRLACLADAVKNICPEINLLLVTPYIPGSRQERYVNLGESLTNKVYINMLNSMNFSWVLIVDPHTNVTPALFDCKVGQIRQEYIYESYLKSLEKDDRDFILVAPDLGAAKKVESLAKLHYKLTGKSIDIIYCRKVRNRETGKLEEFSCLVDKIDNKNCLIVDDICDGGGTFIGVAKQLKLKGAGKLNLIVSHGIFSKGLDELLGAFETISIPYYFSDVRSPKLKLLKNVSKIYVDREINTFN